MSAIHRVARAYTTARKYPHLGRPRTTWNLIAEVPDVGFLPQDFITKRISAMATEDVLDILKTATVTVNEDAIDWSKPLQLRDKITIQIPPPANCFDPMTIDLNVLHDDGAVMVINKAPGICVQPSGEEQLNNILSALHARHRNLEEPHLDRVPHLIHRLDKFTSGVLLIAWDHVIAKRATEQFAQRSVDKAYLALVNGVPKEREGIVDAPIAHDAASEYPLYYVHESGRPSATAYEVEQDFGKVSLVRFRPQTGRTHQIRVHSAHLGHPLLCDWRYGGQEKVTCEDLKRWFGDEKVAAEMPDVKPDEPLLSRIALHSSHVHMMHPTSGEDFKAHAPLAKDMDDFVSICKRLLGRS